jgi:hypothetical protein
MTETAVVDPRRQKPVSIVWNGMVGKLYIAGEFWPWGAVEWSDKRQAWCIEDAEGRCLSHHSHIHGEDRDKAGAVALATAMIRDGRLPTPEDAATARNERVRSDRARRAKQPAQIKRRKERDERKRLDRAAWDAEWKERTVEGEEPLYEVLADALDFADPELWKSNSFARLRTRLIPHLHAAIADLEAGGRGRFRSGDANRRLQRAREILELLDM